MKQGYWGNYHTGAIIEIDEHECWMRRGNNARTLGVPETVIAHFADFQPRMERDALLRYLFAHAPVMRIRGHDASVTFEFDSPTIEAPLTLIESWSKRNAGPCLELLIVNFHTNRHWRLFWRDWPPTF